MELVNNILTVSSLGPQESRRRKLLNILLLGVGTLTALTLVAAVMAIILLGVEDPEEALLLFISIIVMLGGTITIYLINRYWSGSVAASAFLLLLTAVLTLSDSPEQVVSGRTLFLFTIPIIMASVLLRPYASFIIAALISVVIVGISVQIDMVPTLTTPTGFFAAALVSWLAARSLEQALDELRQINRELDQLVAERTRELFDALKREQSESSKNQAILSSIADGVIVFDSEGKAFTANPSLSSLLGMESSEIVGKDFMHIMGDHVAEEDRDMLTELIGSPELINQTVKVDWGMKVFSVSLASVSDNSGVVVVFRDFTAEAELARMKSSFVSMASHELRTPLNAMLGYSDMMKEEVYGALNEKQKNVMERIKVNVNRMLDLVNNLLDSARIEAGKLTIISQSFDVHEMLDDVYSFMHILAKQRGLELTLSVADNLPHQLVSDSERLRQIIVNLVGNALKFTSEGTVSIDITCQAETWILAVKDTGVGIPDDELDKVFDVFKQVDDPITRKQGGSGLGLSIVKQLTELLGGTIQLKSEVGVGSTFTIILPLIRG